MENILTVIDELGATLKKYKDEISFQKYEIERLKNKIEKIEQYTNFYSKE